MASNMITLNVGGTIYTTSKETLTRYKDSMLGKMFKTLDRNEKGGTQVVPSIKDEHGCFVIDRDGPLFRYVLIFLESSLTLPKDFKDLDLDLLKREAEYYQIQPLIDVIDTMIRICIKMASNIMTLNVGGTIYTTSIETLIRYPDSMLGTMFRILKDGNENGGENQLVPSNKDEQGHFVIDRDGPMFRYVLNFLRELSLTLPEDFKDLDLLRREAEFYQIQPLIEAVDKVAGEAVDKVAREAVDKVAREAVDTMDQGPSKKTDCIFVYIHQDDSPSYWEVLGKKEVVDKLFPILQGFFCSCVRLGTGTIEGFDGCGLLRTWLKDKNESLHRLIPVAKLIQVLTDEGFHFTCAQTIEKGPTVKKDRITEGWLMFQR